MSEDHSAIQVLILAEEQKAKWQRTYWQMNGNFSLLDLSSSLRYKCILDGQRNQSFCIRKLDLCLQQAFMKGCVSGSGNNL